MDFDEPRIMGIVNMTPDSFSGDGAFSNPSIDDPLAYAISRIDELIDQGADIIDIGGESTGPDSKGVDLEEEMKRVKPVIDYVKDRNLTEEAFFSIDTYKAPVAEYALDRGFQMVNDVTALRGDSGMIDVLNTFYPFVVLMYSKDSTPHATKKTVEYNDIMKDINGFLLERIEELLGAGFPQQKIIIDPGMGMFVSANPKYSYEIIERLDEMKEFELPILVGVSRKSFLNELANRDQESVHWSLKAIQNGADIVRVHDVGLMKKGIEKL